MSDDTLTDEDAERDNPISLGDQRIKFTTNKVSI